MGKDILIEINGKVRIARLVSIFIVCALLAIPDFIGKELVRAVEKGKTHSPLGIAELKD